MNVGHWDSYILFDLQLTTRVHFQVSSAEETKVKGWLKTKRRGGQEKNTFSDTCSGLVSAVVFNVCLHVSLHYACILCICMTGCLPCVTVCVCVCHFPICMHNLCVCMHVSVCRVQATKSDPSLSLSAVTS